MFQCGGGHRDGDFLPLPEESWTGYLLQLEEETESCLGGLKRIF